LSQPHGAFKIHEAISPEALEVATANDAIGKGQPLHHHY